MDLNQLAKIKKKRTVNKEEWTKEKRKRLRIAGQQYVNAKGQVVPQKEPGPDCKCRRRCYEKVPSSSRLKLFRGYYALKSHDEQNAYLFGLIRKVPIARKRAEGSTRRTCTFNYYIRVGGQETQVCVKALANIHGVGKAKIHILCEKLGQNILFPRDERGRHSKMPKKVSNETIALVRDHIFSVLHSDGVREFLKDEKANNGPDVNITQMHKHFLDIHDPSYQQELLDYERQASNTEQPMLTTSDPYSGLQMFRHVSYNGESELEGDVPIITHVTHLSEAPTVDDSHNVTTNIANPTPKKKRKVTKDGRPEPLIRLWYYSKIFHEYYTTKEAIALRKKIISWKNTEEMALTKPPRKSRGSQKKNLVVQVNDVPIFVSPETAELEENHVIDSHHLEVTNGNHPDLRNGQTHIIQVQAPQRIARTVNTLPITLAAQQTLGPKLELQVQNMPIKKKPVQLQIVQTPGQDQMYSVCPMIFQEVSSIDGQAVNLAQTFPQAHIRAIGPHFPVNHHTATGNTINLTGSLQSLGVNINLQPNITYTTAGNIMQYKFE